MRKIITLILITAITLQTVGCGISQQNETKRIVTSQKVINRIKRYEDNMPKSMEIMDYKERALAFDKLVYDRSINDTFLPLIWDDKKYNTFGMPAYVGDGRMNQDGAQEAVTTIASVLSATQLGIDKSNQDGNNYVAQLSAYFSETERIILNNPSGMSATTSMWYLIYPAILFTQVSILYPQETQIRNEALETIESWYHAYEIMAEQETFDLTGFDFTLNEPYKNGIWTEPDSAAGIALLLYYGYELTDKAEYLDAAQNCINYLNQYFGSSMYEVLLYFAPYLSAMFNADFDTHFDTEDFINDIFDGNSIPRGGWGSIVGTWGDYNMNGLMGSITDGGGYAFAMNTFMAAYSMSPIAKYDTRYAASLGKWFLNVASNSRYFFADKTNQENQSANYNELALAFNEKANSVIPYEGIRKSAQSKTPWFGGDAYVYGWAETDFSLYSGAHMGLFASIIQETDVDGILRIDCNKADLFHQQYETSLIYNPYSTKKTIQYEPAQDDTYHLFDSVTKTYLAKDVTGTVKLELAPEEVVVLMELPVDQEMIHEGNRYKINDNVIAMDMLTIGIENYTDNDEVSGNFKLGIGCASTLSDDQVKEITVIVDDQEYTFDNLKNVKLKASEIGSGSKTFHIKVMMESGLSDETSIRLKL